MKNIKERTCVTCGKKESKDKLLRWVVFKEKIHPDWTQKFPGRSIYTHHSKFCVEGFYDSPKLAAKLLLKKIHHHISKDEVLKHIENQSFTSVKHFFYLGIKSGVLVKGQNLIEECARKQDVFKVCFTASDVAQRTLKNMINIFGERLVKTKLTKDEMGSIIDGRPLGVVAFKGSEMAEKSRFYIDVINNLRSGDIDAY